MEQGRAVVTAALAGRGGVVCNQGVAAGVALVDTLVRAVMGVA